MVISSGKSIPSPPLPSHTLKLNLNTITECVGIEIERLQTRQVYSITPHSQITPSNTTFGLSRNDSNPNEALLSTDKSDSSPHTHKPTPEDGVLIRDERGVAEHNRLQFGEVCSITHTHNHSLSNALTLPSWKEDTPNTTDFRLGKPTPQHSVHPTLFNSSEAE